MKYWVFYIIKHFVAILPQLTVLGLVTIPGLYCTSDQLAAQQACLYQHHQKHRSLTCTILQSLQCHYGCWPSAPLHSSNSPHGWSLGSTWPLTLVSLREFQITFSNVRTNTSNTRRGRQGIRTGLNCKMRHKKKENGKKKNYPNGRSS